MIGLRINKNGVVVGDVSPWLADRNAADARERGLRKIAALELQASKLHGPTRGSKVDRVDVTRAPGGRMQNTSTHASPLRMYVNMTLTLHQDREEYS